MQAILTALDRHSGNKPKAAEELGISLKTLYNKLNQATTLEKRAEGIAKDHIAAAVLPGPAVDDMGRVDIIGPVMRFNMQPPCAYDPSGDK